MKKLLLVIALIASGCTSAGTKISQYCDDNWETHYGSWKECYDHRMEEHRYNTEPLRHIGDGLARPSCTTWNGQTICN